MKKLLLALMMAPMMTMTAYAERTDLGEMKCKELVELASSDEQTTTYLIFWMDGYLSGVSGDTGFDDELIAKFTENIIEKCAASPEASLIETAEAVGLQAPQGQ